MKPQSPSDATNITRSKNQQVLTELPFDDRQDFDDAARGFVATVPNLKVAQNNVPIWDLPKYDFLKEDTAPDTVNPSAWRIAQLNMNNGLFKVVDGVYQIRGFDLSNMTIIEGKTGVILVDPLISPIMAKTGLDLYYKQCGQKPVVAVIYTHSHIDHYGGVKGVISEADVASGQVQILAPSGFTKEVVSENVYAGVAMGRRAMYQYGVILGANAKGQIDAGLGKNASLGTSSLIVPTDLISKTGETRVIDGVEFEFQMAPGTEAPAEMLLWLPQYNLLDAAEDATHTLHNLYTLRGAQVRDSLQWWKTLNEALTRYGDKIETIIAQHHWPMWDNARIVPYLESQRDMFKYLHDQTLNLANHGLTMVEVAEQIQLPDSIGKQWQNRGYYGSVNHNVKAIYQRYLGWYDSNPAHLYNLPPVDTAKKYVDYMGGPEKVLEMARGDYDAGNYRWVAEVCDRVVFAYPDHTDAKNLEAAALEQLGYQTENPTWRNEFLQGAAELRNGVPTGFSTNPASPDVVAAMPPDMLLDYMGIRLNGPKAEHEKMSFVWNLPDGKTYAIELRNGVLIYTPNKKLEQINATITADKTTIAGLIMGGQTLDDAVKSGSVKIDGNQADFAKLLGLLDRFEMMFNIVTP